MAESAVWNNGISGHADWWTLERLRARRHSRLVRIMRILTPVACVVAVACFVMGLFETRRDGQLIAAPDPLVVDGAAITMEAPRLTGYNAVNRPYDVVAARAEQRLDTPDIVDMTALNARFGLSGEGFARFSATTGRFNTTERLLALSRGVRVTSNVGYEANLSSAEVELDAGRIQSREPVTVTLGNSRLVADSMEILDGGDRMLFRGNVSMRLVPTPSPEESPAP